MGSEHYFSAQPATPEQRKTITVELAGSEHRVETAGGIFSPDGLDKGTAVLLAGAPAPANSGHLLDIGCGWGPIALTLALASPDATVHAIDVNERSINLTRDNAAALGLENLRAGQPDSVPSDVEFATIWSNPPIRVGKQALHELLLKWLPRLAPGGTAWLVVQKNLGADSLLPWLNRELPSGFSAVRDSTAKSFRLLKVERAG
ncbi:class I SAM-dependent methyltransferase [Zhihengliuella salsuginis]|uniref:16S RNA G1207 methylase RsmC n=1 Tax=Zhihengliuella salsuginis TaxID=578222 RepID=A0ABQ3GJ99_9MICC|nr:methyltransferase [Zhihengliuella salsuginis]GHD07282.1 16S RNA G1207 methylase RsmC [Zhihengliuella salsuginis]